MRKTSQPEVTGARDGNGRDAWRSISSRSTAFVRRRRCLPPADGAHFSPAARSWSGSPIPADSRFARWYSPTGSASTRSPSTATRAEIGAAVTMARIAAEPKLAFLKPVAESIGGPAIRNMATVGGNLFARYPYGDFAVALLALDADVVIEDGTTERARRPRGLPGHPGATARSSARCGSRFRPRAPSASPR